MTALARGRAALDTITSGEWNYHRDDADGLRYIHDMDTGDMCVDITANGSGSSVEDADLEFIAAAPGLVRDLCDDVERLQVEAVALQEQLRWFPNPHEYEHRARAIESEGHSKRADDALAERDAALANIERVKAMHYPWGYEGETPHCDHDGIAWPCPTIQALGDQ